MHYRKYIPPDLDVSQLDEVPPPLPLQELLGQHLGRQPALHHPGVEVIAGSLVLLLQADAEKIFVRFVKIFESFAGTCWPRRR